MTPTPSNAESTADYPPVVRHPPPRAVPRLPGYEVLGELGRGGMAVVYQARQMGLNRPVALKLMLSGAHAGPEERLRLRREAEAVARLRHPNVVQIYHIGEHEGHLYLSLEYVPGGSLERRLAARPMAPREAAALVQRLAAGVQAAHDAGVVHRDLKPSNVLLDEAGDPKVSDFGLARYRDEARLTATGFAAGTPNYMAPEQVAPGGHGVGPATDVYGLGGILYECLTGRPPFEASTGFEAMRRVANEEVVPVRRLRAAVPAELETVCLKCLEKDPRRRYASARELADDLARFLAHEPVRARPVGAAGRLWRWARRHPALPLSALALLLTAATAALLMARATYHAYQVAGHLRDRELHLHGLRATLLQLHEAQARGAELAAATGDAAWAAQHAAAARAAALHRADAARLAASAVGRRESAAVGATLDGRRAEAWALLRSADHARARADYEAAVGRFGDRVDAEADAELRQLRAEAFWSLAAAGAVAALVGGAAVVGGAALRRGRLKSPAPESRTDSEASVGPGTSDAVPVGVLCDSAGRPLRGPAGGGATAG